MIKIEAKTLEEAYQNAASSLGCSVTELKVEVVQSPSAGVLGFFKKNAIIIATKDVKEKEIVPKEIIKTESSIKPKNEKIEEQEPLEPVEKVEEIEEKHTKKEMHTILNDTIMPASFVNMQDEDEDVEDDSTYLADYDDEEDEVIDENMALIASDVKREINELFNLTCFNIDEIDVRVFDENTLLIEFKGNDAALLIGKEGYRYKALSYMIFNWVNAKYQVQLRLEIAEFLKNQEESVSRYLETVYENVDRDGRAQTKILDGVLIQIALKELRNRYHDKYVAIRSTRDGMKYIIINDYHSN